MVPGELSSTSLDHLSKERAPKRLKLADSSTSSSNTTPIDKNSIYAPMGNTCAVANDNSDGITQNLKPSPNNNNNNNNNSTEEECFEELESSVELNLNEIESFFLQEPVSKEERRWVDSELKLSLEQILSQLEGRGALKAYQDYSTQKKVEQEQASVILEKNAKKKMDGENLPLVDTIPRCYQIKLLHRAAERNTIVHLGTGMGKTLIAILLIKKLLNLEQDHSNNNNNNNNLDSENKQIVFLVPSVPLVLQQTTTLKANLPLVVGTAFRATVRTEESRQRLSKCNVLVATHGAFLDLLLHYGDLFSLSGVRLLILDECHNCVKKSPYATIMRQFYHTLPPNERPRVLGLTASPLINIKKNCAEEELALKLVALEQILDARVVPLTDLGLDPDEIPAFLRKEAQEQMIRFHRNTSSISVDWQDWIDCEKFAKRNNHGLNVSRIKEFKQLRSLYEDLGPDVTRLFCEQLQRTITRNAYEEETEPEYNNAKSYLNHVVLKCQEECQIHKSRKYTPKLQALHRLLDQQFSTRPDAVGLVFVQRRVTAIALHRHLRQVSQSLQPTKPHQGNSHEIQPDRHTNNNTNNVENSSSSTALEDGEIMEVDSTLPVELPTTESESPQNNDDNLKQEQKQDHDETLDQFADADDDPFDEAMFRKPTKTLNNNHHHRDNQIQTVIPGPEDPPFRVLVKSSALVRKPSKMFRVSRKRESSALLPEDDNNNELGEASQEATQASIRDVLNSMRRREINLLIATSVVEEGVDIQACSFVVVFDPLTSLKAFIQMKGRARQKEASFFVFEEDQAASADVLPLSTVKDVEARVNRFLASRPSSFGKPGHQSSMDREEPLLFGGTKHFTENSNEGDEAVELRALALGNFSTKYGTLGLSGAKSLLQRYALSQPMDPAVRTSQTALRAHMPTFDFESNLLSIPSHLSTFQDVRVVSLPECYWDRNKKDRESLVSLRACVRLYNRGLLNERLLPLCEKDIQDRFVEVSTGGPAKEALIDVVLPPVTPSVSDAASPASLYLHTIIPTGEDFLNSLNELNPEGRRLAILSWTPIARIPDFHYSLLQFGSITHKLGDAISVVCSRNEIDLASKFYELIWNSRWKRRTHTTRFQCRSPSSTYIPYRVVCVDSHDQVDWPHMDELIRESERSLQEREKIVREIDTKKQFSRPRIWSPCYDRNATYLVFGPSSDVCDSEFPHDHQDERIKTYRDYYEYQHQCHVPAQSVLFEATRLWQLPRRAWSEAPKPIEPFKKVKLPHVACMEAVLADAGMSLLTVLLPQFCYHVELYANAFKLLEHVQANVPQLGSLLLQIPMPKIFCAITAKSCNALACYEKMEWLGDGVLKLAQTDSLVNSTDLGGWIRHLPEGYLNAARSFMGSNRNLTAACKRLKLDKFIQTRSLSRGWWTPEPMDLVDEAGTSLKRLEQDLDGKVCADVLESLLGLVFLELGFEKAMLAADALQLTIPYKQGELLSSCSENMTSCRESKLLAAAESFTGRKPFIRKSLVEEALTHPTMIATSTNYSSYQRLEWIGDAVLCLSIRSWIYESFPDLELGEMVVLEATLVCNETLAFLALQAGLPQHLRHGDQTLPNRIENYVWTVRGQGRGLWGTDPPKALADCVEALFGAVHVDGGFHAGQEAVRHALRTVLSALKKSAGSDFERYSRHPKRSVSSLLGILVTIEQSTEEALASSSPDLRIWCGDQWMNPHPNSNRPVALLKCFGNLMLAVADSVVSSAVNRACAFILSFLWDNPTVLERFRALHADLQRSLGETSPS